MSGMHGQGEVCAGLDDAFVQLLLEGVAVSWENDAPRQIGVAHFAPATPVEKTTESRNRFAQRKVGRHAVGNPEVDILREVEIDDCSNDAADEDAIVYESALPHN